MYYKYVNLCVNFTGSYAVVEILVIDMSNTAASFELVNFIYFFLRFTCIIPTQKKSSSSWENRIYPMQDKHKLKQCIPKSFHVLLLASKVSESCSVSIFNMHTEWLTSDRTISQALLCILSQSNRTVFNPHLPIDFTQLPKSEANRSWLDISESVHHLQTTSNCIIGWSQHKAGGEQMSAHDRQGLLTSGL